MSRSASQVSDFTRETGLIVLVKPGVGEQQTFVVYTLLIGHLKLFISPICGFIGLGMKNPDKVALFLPNTPETIFALLGVLSSGCVLIPLDFMLTQEEIINFLTHSESKVLIIQPKKNIDLKAIKDSYPDLEQVIVFGEKLEGFPFWED